MIYRPLRAFAVEEVRLPLEGTTPCEDEQLLVGLVVVLLVVAQLVVAAG